MTFGGQFAAGSLDRDNTIYVNYRFGSGVVEEGYWVESDSYRAAFVPDADLQQFLESVWEGPDEFVIRAWNFDDSVIGTIYFDLSGARTALEPVLEACGA